jgi:hypothetical protein
LIKQPDNSVNVYLDEFYERVDSLVAVLERIASALEKKKNNRRRN